MESKIVTTPLSKNNWKIITIVILGVFLVFIIVSAFFLMKHQYTFAPPIITIMQPSPTTTNEPTPTPSSSAKIELEKLKGNNIFFTIENSTLKGLSNITTNVSSQFAESIDPVADNNGNIYYIKNKQLHKYNLFNKKQSIIDINVNENDQLSFFDNNLYLETMSSYDEPDKNATIREINLSTNAQRILTLPPISKQFSRSRYESGYYYLFKFQNYDIVYSGGGDGCGSSGSIYKYLNALEKTVEFGGGCYTDLPYNLGFIKDQGKIVLLSFIPKTTDSDGMDEQDYIYTLDKLYFKNVIDGSEEIIFDNKDSQIKITNAYLSYEGNRVILQTKDELIIINLQSKSIEKVIRVDNPALVYLTAINNSIYMLDQTDHSKLFIIPIETGSIMELNLNEIISLGNNINFSDYQFMGIWKNNPIFKIHP